MKFLPAWLRHLIAAILVVGRREWGGVLYDYANGKYEKIMEWNSEAGLQEAGNILSQAVGGRDYIYLTASKTGQRAGYFMVDSSANFWYLRAFHPAFYTADEAMVHAGKKMRKLATKLGFRNPEEKV